jgi:hypothetical protein
MFSGLFVAALRVLVGEPAVRGGFSWMYAGFLVHARGQRQKNLGLG